MADYTKTTWVDDDGSSTTGTLFTAARMNNIESGVKDAVDAHATGLYSARPAAAAGNKNWFYYATDVGVLYRSDGSSWTRMTADAPLGSIADFIMPIPPAGWLAADGSERSRSLYADLFAASVKATSGTSANGSNTVTNVLAGGTSAQADAFIAAFNKTYIEGPGITLGTKVTGMTNTGGGFVSVTLSANAGAAAGAGTFKFYGWGFGDGSTTFNLPLLTSRVRVPIGSSPPASSTQHYMGETGGEETHLLTVTEMPSHAHTGTSASSTSTGSSGTQSANHTHSGTTAGPNSMNSNLGSAAGFNPGWYNGSLANSFAPAGSANTHTHSITTGTESANHTHTITVGTTTTVTVAPQGGDTAHQNMQPYAGVYAAVKVY